MKSTIDTTSRNILILHGVGGYPEENSFGWLKQELQALGHRVTVPQFPTMLPDDVAAALFPQGTPKQYASFKHQSFSEWNDTAQASMPGWNPENTILVGHSLGAWMALRLAGLSQETPYHAVIAVSPRPEPRFRDDPDYDQGMATFYENVDWEAIRRGAKHITVISSPDDPIVRFDQSWSAAQQARADRFMTILESGHFNADAGYRTFPQLLAYIKERILQDGGITPAARPPAQPQSILLFRHAPPRP